MNSKDKFVAPKEIRKGVTTDDSFEHMMITASLGFPDEFDLDKISKITTYRVPNISYKIYDGIKIKKLYKGPVILIDIPIASDGIDSMYEMTKTLKANEHFLEWRSLANVVRFIFKYPEGMICGPKT